MEKPPGDVGDRSTRYTSGQITRTEELLAAADLPPLEGAERRAELLVMLAHRCIDWDVWGGSRMIRYWDAFTERVGTACYAGPSIADWWRRMSVQMNLVLPYSSEEKLLLASIMSAGEDRAVLNALRSHAQNLVLRVRVAIDVKNESKSEEADEQGALL